MSTKTIPVRLWGRDHWTTLAYIETRCVDHRGVPDRNHMRTDPDIHPGLVGDRMSYLATSEKHPTRLTSGVEVEDHDDWSCVEDAEHAGFVEWNGTGLNPIFKLTKAGRRVCDAIRDHRSNGGQFATFEWDH